MFLSLTQKWVAIIPGRVEIFHDRPLGYPANEIEYGAGLIIGPRGPGTAERLLAGTGVKKLYHGIDGSAFKQRPVRAGHAGLKEDLELRAGRGRRICPLSLKKAGVVRSPGWASQSRIRKKDLYVLRVTKYIKVILLFGEILVNP